MKKIKIPIGSITIKTMVTCPNCWETASVYSNDTLYCNHCDYTEKNFEE